MQIRLAQHGIEAVFDKFRLAFLNEQHCLFVGAEPSDLIIDQRIGNVQHIDGNVGVAKAVRQPNQFQCANQIIVHSALDDDPDIAGMATEKFVHLVVADEFYCSWPAVLDLFPLVEEIGGRQNNPVGIALGIFHRVLQAKGRSHIILGDEFAIEVAGPDAKFQHHWCVRCFGQLKPRFDHFDDRGKMRTRVEQPDLRLHGKSVRPLLHDRRSFAIVLANNDQRAALDAA